ncbi:MAG: DUF4062 domain-containing protein [Chloroflexi bacterium]|nr:DUF4062 domain-containing protein [Chloroflexota bacterium]
MEKRYQVFISSTFADLKDERQAVLRAVLELDQMPAGMELFPAADDSAWQLIKDVIDASDYYVVIIGGRYGSLDETGLGYTEKEYEYATSAKKPVIPLLHEKPDNLPRDKTETEEATWKKLQAFRAKVEKRHTCVYWKTAEELKAKVIVGLTAAMKRHPTVGWVRADQVPAEATIAEVLALRNRVVQLETEVAAARVTPPVGTEALAQGDDMFEISMSFEARPPGSFGEWTGFTTHFRLTWNEIFAAVAPTMIGEASDSDLTRALVGCFNKRARDVLPTYEDLKGRQLGNFGFRDDQIETCIVQIRALGLISESVRQRSVKDTKTYWSLTPYGDYLMTQLRAIRRTPTEPAKRQWDATERSSDGDRET